MRKCGQGWLHARPAGRHCSRLFLTTFRPLQLPRLRSGDVGRRRDYSKLCLIGSGEFHLTLNGVLRVLFFYRNQQYPSGKLGFHDRVATIVFFRACKFPVFVSA